MTMVKGQEADHVGLGNSHGHRWAVAGLSELPPEGQGEGVIENETEKKPCLPMSFLLLEDGKTCDQVLIYKQVA